MGGVFLFVFVLKTKKKSQDILSGFVWAGSLSTTCCEEQPFLAFHISDYTNSDRCIFHSRPQVGVFVCMIVGIVYENNNHCL